MLNILLDFLIPKKLIFIKLGSDQVTIKDMTSGESIFRKSSIPFSNKRLVIADFIVAEKFLREVINELPDRKNKILKKAIKVVVQIVDADKYPITNVENRIYQDLIQHIGASHFWLVDHINEVSDEEVLTISKQG